MTNKIILNLSLLLIPVFSAIGMEEKASANEKGKDKIVCEKDRDAELACYEKMRTNYVNRIATCAELRYDAMPIDEQGKYCQIHKFINDKNPSESDSFSFFNDVAQVIAYDLNRTDIFSDELQLLYIEKGPDFEQLDIFFNEFCPRIQGKIIMEMLYELRIGSIAEKCTLVGTIVSHLVQSSRNIQLICSLATKLRRLKDKLLIESFRALNSKKQNGFSWLTYSDLINLPLFKLLTKSYNGTRRIAKRYTKALEDLESKKEQSDNLLEHVSLTPKASGCFCYLFSDDQAVPEESERRLSINERASIGRYLFLEYLVIFPELLCVSSAINLKLSTIYDNNTKPLYSLGLDGWQKRVKDLMDICQIAEIVNPNGYALSKYIHNPELLGPKAKCMYYLNNQITQCVAAKAVQNLIIAAENSTSRNEIEDTANNLKFLLKNLDRVFFKKCLRLISNELKSVINKIATSAHTNKFSLELDAVFYETIDLLTAIMPSIELGLLDFAKHLCKEVGNYTDQKLFRK